jgi:hypothetical protein
VVYNLAVRTFTDARGLPMTTTNLRTGLAPLALALALIAAAACDDSSGKADGGPIEGGAGSGGSGGGGGGGSGGSGGSPSASCGISEANEPGNNTRDNPTPYTAGSDVVGCVGDTDDVDFFSVTAPTGDPAGGYYEGSVTNVGAGNIDVKVYSASDNSAILQSTYTTTDGASLYFYWAAAPGQVYRLAVSKFSAWDAPYRYTLKASYTKINDANEPNDTRDMAKTIALGTETTGLFYSGFKGMKIADTEYEDWYAVTLEAGKTVTIKVLDVATNVRPQVELFDPDSTEVNDAGMYNITPGGSINVTAPKPPASGPPATLTKAGVYKLKVDIFSVLPEASDKLDSPGMLPDSFKRPYKLTVTQP